MKVCITGGCGYIGRNLVHRLEPENEVHIIDSLANSNTHWNTSAQFHYHDLSDPNQNGSNLKKRFLRKLRGCDTIVHLAATKVSTADSYGDMIQNNLSSTAYTIDLAKALGVKRIVFASSAAVYGEGKGNALWNMEEDTNSPPTPYGLSKLECERILSHASKNLDLAVVSLRLFNVWGGIQNKVDKHPSVYQYFKKLQASMTGTPVVIYGNGDTERDYVHVSDVVEAIVKAMDPANPVLHKPGYGVYNVCTGRGTKVDRLAEYILGDHYPKEYRPLRPNEIEVSVGSPNRMKIAFGWEAKYDILNRIPYPTFPMSQP